MVAVVIIAYQFRLIYSPGALQIYKHSTQLSTMIVNKMHTHMYVNIYDTCVLYTYVSFFYDTGLGWITIHRKYMVFAKLDYKPLL